MINIIFSTENFFFVYENKNLPVLLVKTKIKNSLILESGKREWGNTTYEMPETTSKDDIIGQEDSFPCKNIQFYYLFFSYISKK